MILGYKTKNDRKIEELEEKMESNHTLFTSYIEHHEDVLSSLEREKTHTKERFIEYIDKRTHLYTGLHERLEKIESIGDFEVLMKRVARVEEQFGPILGKVTDTFQSAMNTLISEAAKTNQYMADQVKVSDAKINEMMGSVEFFKNFKSTEEIKEKT